MAKLVVTEHITGTLQFWLRLFNLKKLKRNYMKAQTKYYVYGQPRAPSK